MGALSVEKLRLRGYDYERDLFWLVKASVTRDLSRYFSENICRSRGNLKFTCQKSSSLFSSRICQQFDIILLWTVECNILKKDLLKQRLGISRFYLKLVNWIHLVFELREKVRKISRTVNSTAWPLQRIGSTNFVCTCFDNCMFIWFFWQSIKNFSGSHQRDILAAISTEIRFCQGEGTSTLNEQQDLAFVIEFR